MVHDIGHLPFSHSSEGILPKKSKGRANKHEDVSIAIVRGEELTRILKRHFYREAADHVCRLLDESADVPPELLILRKLLSGQFDADKMDYLSRDSLHCGVGYGNFDYLRLLETIRIKKAEQGGFELSVERGGLHTLEAMMLARYWMFTQVYFHKTRRIYERYLSNYLQRWYSGQYADLQNVLNYDDISLMAGIVADSRSRTGDAERRGWAQRIVNRQHHRVVYETSSHASPKDEKIALKVEGALKKRYPRTDFILDRAEQRIHDFYIEGVDEKMGEEFPVFDTVTERYLPLSKESRIFEKVPKSFRIIRIYGDVPKDGVPKYRDFARTKANILEEEV